MKKETDKIIDLKSQLYDLIMNCHKGNEKNKQLIKKKRKEIAREFTVNKIRGNNG